MSSIRSQHAYSKRQSKKRIIYMQKNQRCYQDQGVRDQDQTGRDRDRDRDQDQDQDLKKVVLIGLETKTRSRDMYAMLLYKSSKS